MRYAGRYIKRRSSLCFSFLCEQYATGPDDQVACISEVQRKVSKMIAKPQTQMKTSPQIKD